MKKVMVLGASLNSSRYSNMAIKKLKLKEYDVIGIGSRIGEVQGVSILTEAKLMSDIHTVTVYLNPMNQRLYYDYNNWSFIMDYINFIAYLYTPTKEINR